MIQNYDSNGLIFALNFKAVGHDIRSPIYHEAIKNILDANKFDCIPLVDGERKRLNQNNLNDRAIYSEDGGNVTHIARRRIYDDENEDIIITRIENIPHLSNDTELIEALVHFFNVKNSGDRCHFAFTVGGTEQKPEALFTMHQLKQERTLKELFGRILMAGFSKKNSNIDTQKTVKDIFKIVTDYKKRDLNWDDISTELTDIITSLSKLSVEGLTKFRQTSSEFISRSKNIGYLTIKDVMTKVACGVNWSFDENGNPSTGTESDILAKDLVCKANKFTNLVVYDNGILKPEYTIKKDMTRPKSALTANTCDDYSKLLANIDDTNESNFCVVVLPNENLITSEGPMIWPGIVTPDDVKELPMLMAYTAICVSIEDTIQEKFAEMKKSRLHHAKYNLTTGKYEKHKSSKKENTKFAWDVKTEDQSLGTLAAYFRGEKSISDGQQRGKTGVIKIFKSEHTFEGLFQTGVSMSDKKLVWIADMRNKLAHEALSMNPRKEHHDLICLQNIKWMYEIAKGLKIL